MIPNTVASLVYKVFGRFIESAEPKDSVLPMGATLELQRQERMDQIEQQVLLQSIRDQGPLYNPNQGAAYNPIQVYRYCYFTNNKICKALGTLP